MKGRIVLTDVAPERDPFEVWMGDEARKIANYARFAQSIVLTDAAPPVRVGTTIRVRLPRRFEREADTC